MDDLDRRRGEKASANAERAAKSVDTQALQKLSATQAAKSGGQVRRHESVAEALGERGQKISTLLSAAKAPAFDNPFLKFKEGLAAPAAKIRRREEGRCCQEGRGRRQDTAAGAKATAAGAGVAAAAQRAAEAAREAGSNAAQMDFEAPDFSGVLDSYHDAFPTVSDDVLDIAALVVVPLVLIAGGTARDGGKARECRGRTLVERRRRPSDCARRPTLINRRKLVRRRARPKSGNARPRRRRATKHDRTSSANASGSATREARGRAPRRAARGRAARRGREARRRAARARRQARGEASARADEKKRADERMSEEKRLADERKRNEQKLADEKSRQAEQREAQRLRDEKAARRAARPTRAPAWRKRPAAAPGPYDASQFMKFCIKFDKFYATQEDGDVHFARWKERSKYVEEYNRGLGAGRGEARAERAGAICPHEEVAELA